MRQKIEAALKKLQLESQLENTDLFLKYLEQLEYWNKAYNLTAIRDPEQMLIQHLFDCLVIIPEIYQRWPVKAKHIVDIGSGAGLPGIILAICLPEWQISCVDAVGKKTAFIRQASGVLGLNNLKAIHGRVEKLPFLNADFVISRAFSSLTDFVRLSEMHLHDDSLVLAMKAQYPTDEIKQLEETTKWAVKENIKLEVPCMQAERCLLVLA